MVRETFTVKSSDGIHQIPGMIYLPEGDIRGVCQVAHGMCDYGARYEELCLYLANHGYIAAYHDHLGHGDAVDDEEEYGYFAERDGAQYLIDDVDRVFELLEQRYPGYKHYVIGHSMGSFITRIYVAQYRDKAAGAILLGSGKNAAARFGTSLANLVVRLKGGRYRSKFVNNLAFNRYNSRVPNSVSAWDWLSREQKAGEEFLGDDKRKRTFTVAGFHDLFQLVHLSNHDKTLQQTPRDLPMLFLSGSKDPLGGYGKGITSIVRRIESQNFKDVELKIYKDARHELCHEINREEVFEDIAKWLNCHTPSASSRSKMMQKGSKI